MRTLSRERLVRVSPPPQDHRRGEEGSVIFAGQSRDQLRETYRAAWRRYKQQHTLSPLDKQVVAVISEHPEYHVIVESAAADLANYSPRSGQLNPWLHMGLHLAGGAHEAEHRMLEVLAEQLWEAQRGGKAPDESAYLERLKTLF